MQLSVPSRDYFDYMTPPRALIAQHDTPRLLATRPLPRVTAPRGRRVIVSTSISPSSIIIYAPSSYTRGHGRTGLRADAGAGFIAAAESSTRSLSAAGRPSTIDAASMPFHYY